MTVSSNRPPEFLATGNQRDTYFVITYKGKESEKNIYVYLGYIYTHIYTYIGTPETNTL